MSASGSHSSQGLTVIPPWPLPAKHPSDLTEPNPQTSSEDQVIITIYSDQTDPWLRQMANEDNILSALVPTKNTLPADEVLHFSSYQLHVWKKSISSKTKRTALLNMLRVIEQLEKAAMAKFFVVAAAAFQAPSGTLVQSIPLASGGAVPIFTSPSFAEALAQLPQPLLDMDREERLELFRQSRKTRSQPTSPPVGAMSTKSRSRASQRPSPLIPYKRSRLDSEGTPGASSFTSDSSTSDAALDSTSLPQPSAAKTARLAKDTDSEGEVEVQVQGDAGLEEESDLDDYINKYHDVGELARTIRTDMLLQIRKSIKSRGLDGGHLSSAGAAVSFLLKQYDVQTVQRQDAAESHAAEVATCHQRIADLQAELKDQATANVETARQAKLASDAELGLARSGHAETLSRETSAHAETRTKYQREHVAHGKTTSELNDERARHAQTTAQRNELLNQAIAREAAKQKDSRAREERLKEVWAEAHGGAQWEEPSTVAT